MEWLQPDGILGLAPPPIYDVEEGADNKHWFVKELKKDRYLESAIFALYITDLETSSSKIQFGGYDMETLEASYNGVEKHYKNAQREDGVFWLEINSNDYWELVLYKAVVPERLPGALNKL